MPQKHGALKRIGGEKRLKSLLRKTYGDHISRPYLHRYRGNKQYWPWSWLVIGGSKVFSVDQRQHIQQGLKKAGIASTECILLDDKEAILSYLRGEITEADLPSTFALHDTEQRERARNLQEGRYHADTIAHYGITQTISIAALKQWVNNYDPTNPEYAGASKQSIADNATKLLLSTLRIIAQERKYQEDLFFTDGSGKYKNVSPDDISGIHRTMFTAFQDVLSHGRAGLELCTQLYGTYGLREILHGVDAHYAATGIKIEHIAPRTLGNIILMEGISHCVGLGIEQSLRNLIPTLIMGISHLRGAPSLSTDNLEVLLQNQANRFVGKTKKQEEWCTQRFKNLFAIVLHMDRQ